MHPQIILRNTTYSSKLCCQTKFRYLTLSFTVHNVLVHAHDTAGQVLLFINTTAHPS